MRARTWTGAMLIAAAVTVAAAAVVTRAGATEEVREIHLVARGMAFYLEADPATVNPTIVVRRGELVRIVLQNQTPGIDHDLAVASLGVGVTPVAAGQTAAFDLQAPDTAGRHEYVCRPHAVMMKGTVVVQ